MCFLEEVSSIKGVLRRNQLVGGLRAGILVQFCSPSGQTGGQQCSPGNRGQSLVRPVLRPPPLGDHSPVSPCFS